jgi:hypothetical protein
MRTQILGQLEIDEPGLRGDLACSAGLPYSEHYTEFVCGRAWKSCMLWEPGGQVAQHERGHARRAAGRGRAPGRADDHRAEALGMVPIPCRFRSFNSFGGSFHCATLDIHRRGSLQSYF